MPPTEKIEIQENIPTALPLLPIFQNLVATPIQEQKTFLKNIKTDPVIAGTNNAMTAFKRSLITKNQPDSVTFYVQNIETLLKNISPTYWHKAGVTQNNESSIESLLKNISPIYSQTKEFAPNWQSTAAKKLPISIDVLTSGHGTVTIDRNFLANMKQDQKPFLLLENVQQQNNNSWPDELIQPVFQTKNSHLKQKKILESFFVVENNTPFKQNPYIPAINAQVVSKNEFIPFLQAIIERVNETDAQTESTGKELFETEDAMLFRNLLEDKKNDPEHFLTLHNEPVDLEMEMITKPKQMAHTGSDNTGKMTFYIENLHAMLEKVAPDFSHTKGLAQNIVYSDPRFPLTIHLDTDGHGTVTFEKQVLINLPDDNNALQGLLTYFNNDLMPKNSSKTLPFLAVKKKKNLTTIYNASFDTQTPSKFFVFNTKKLKQGALQYEPKPDIYMIESFKFMQFLQTIFNRFYIQEHEKMTEQEKQIEVFNQIKESKKTELKIPKLTETDINNAKIEKFKKAVKDRTIKLQPKVNRKSVDTLLQKQKNQNIRKKKLTPRIRKIKPGSSLLEKLPFFKK